MVSTRSRVGVTKQTEAGPTAPASTNLDLTAILEGQVKMQQELADLKKRSADEMKALRQENSRLRRKIEADPTQKGKAMEASKAPKCPAYQPSEQESEYNATPNTFTTTQQTPNISTYHTHFHPTLPGHTATPTTAATLPTTHIPPHNFTSTFPTLVHHHIPPHPLPPQPPKRRHSFNDSITNTPLPTQWEAFMLDRYTGETDPDEHLKIYITHVALYTSHDVIFCKAFPTTLKGHALEWFTSLLPYSIDCFDTLPHMFTTHFAGNRPHQTTTLSLLGVRQEQDETLRAFIDRFSKAALRTHHINQEMILQCIALTLTVRQQRLPPPTRIHAWT